jgi:hypothetical protein
MGSEPRADVSLRQGERTSSVSTTKKFSFWTRFRFARDVVSAEREIRAFSGNHGNFTERKKERTCNNVNDNSFEACACACLTLTSLVLRSPIYLP